MSRSQPGNKHNEKYSSDKFLELYNKGMNDSEIAREMGCNHATITMKRKTRNLPKNFKYISKIDKEELVELHRQGYTTIQLVKHFKVSDSQIQSKCAEWGIEINTTQNKIKELTYEEEQVVLGLILGDGTLRKDYHGKYTGTSLSYAHCIKQQEYAEHKAKLLQRIISSTGERSQIHYRTGNRHYNVTVRSISTIALNKYYPMFYENKKKFIGAEVMNKIDALGMAIWYMDDGCAGTHRGYYLCTNGFLREDVEKATEIIEKRFGIKASVVNSSIKQPMIFIGVRGGNSHKFEQLIRPYIIPSMLYKLHPEGVTIPRGPYRPGKPIIVSYKGEFYKEYPNVEIAAKEIKMDRRCIDTVLKGTRKRRSYKTKDWTFQYKPPATS